MTNPHFDNAEQAIHAARLVTQSDVKAALGAEAIAESNLAIAYEQRTANLIAKQDLFWRSQVATREGILEMMAEMGVSLSPATPHEFEASVANWNTITEAQETMAKLIAPRLDIEANEWVVPDGGE